MKPFTLSLVFLLSFGAMAQSSKVKFIIGKDVTTKVDPKVLDHIRQESRKSFRGFRLNSKARERLNRGDTVDPGDFYRKRISVLRALHRRSGGFYLIRPDHLISISYFKNRKLDLYYIIDQNLSYFQVVALDTSSISKVYFLSGYVSKRAFTTFNEFYDFAYVVEDQFFVRKSEFESEDYQRKTVKELWMSIQMIPFVGFGSNSIPVTYLRDPLDSSQTYWDNEDIRIFPERFDLGDTGNQLSKRLRHWTSTPNFKPYQWDPVHLNADGLKYYSTNLETVARANQGYEYPNLTFHFKDSVSFDSVQHWVEDRMKNFKRIDSVRLFCWMGDSLVDAPLYEFKRVKPGFYNLTYWGVCKYMCPFLFSAQESLNIAREYEMVYDKKTDRLRLVLKRKCKSVAVIKEIRSMN